MNFDQFEKILLAAEIIGLFGGLSANAWLGAQLTKALQRANTPALGNVLESIEVGGSVASDAASEATQALADGAIDEGEASAFTAIAAKITRYVTQKALK